MLHVKWDRDVLHFPFPPLDTPLGTLRAELAAYTHLPASSFKLVYKGAVMKEDGAPLSTYKLKPGATIALIGGHTAPTPTSEKLKTSAPATKPKNAATVPQTEQGTIMAIRQELERVRETLVPDVNTFVQALARPSPSGTVHANEPNGPPTPLDHTRLSELLLQSLLRLDAMHMSGADWPEARLQRKAAVREVQGVLDRLDGAWAGRC